MVSNTAPISLLLIRKFVSDMKSQNTLAVRIAGELSEAIAYHLVSEGALGSSLTDDEGALPEQTVTVYFLGEEIPEKAREYIDGYGGRIVDQTLLSSDVDYVRESQAQWFPIHFPSCQIVPFGKEQDSSSSLVSLLIKPGSGFGTGHHHTTKMLVGYLDRLCRHRSGGSEPPFSHFWDIGAGSALLSIAATALFDIPGVAWECDPLAVENAQENIALNDMQDRIRLIPDFFRESVEGSEEQGSLPLSRKSEASPEIILSNLYSTLHYEFEETYFRSLAPDGLLLLSGVMAEEHEEFSRTFGKCSWQRVSVLRSGAWLAFVFQKPSIDIQSNR
ncbi:50S ribosomal protein L11 methyltransferase [bacterium]|nr:50S ribosomal protein L11 methyltransferase [bacterium]